MLNTYERTPGLAELKVSYRRGKARHRNQLAVPFVVNSPLSCEEYLRAVWDKDTIELREEFVLVCVNASLEALGWVKLATGGLDSAPIDPRLVFGVALQVAATGIIVAHNHPSGSLKPSGMDREATERLRRGAELLGIQFLDHVILSRHGAFSFARAGLLNA